MLTIGSNPHDYGLPSDTWYAHQTEMVGAAVNLPYHGILVIEGPCGTGKSFAPATVSHFRPGTTVIVGTRDLQSQYADTLDFSIVWGQEHYPCIWEERVKDYHNTYGCDPTRADCPFNKPSTSCTYFSSCPYEQAKVKAYGSPRIVLNVAYAYHTNWWRMGRTNWDLFLDEAHRMPEELSNLISVTVGTWVRKHYELPEFPDITESGERRQKAIRTAYDWLGKCVELMTPWCNVRDEQKALKAKRFQANLKQLHDVLADAQPGMWYIESSKELFSAKPVVPGIYASKLIANQSRSLTLMSATIGDAETLLDELGMGGKDYQFISLPHAFPQSNRPVFWVQSAPRMRNRTTDAEYRYQAGLISSIIQQHKGEKGLIHTASWHHAKALMGYLGSNGVSDRMMLAEGNRIETVEQFKMSAPGTVAVSPSWREGLNFPDDECRFCIVAKTPFLSLADPIIRMRLAQDGGNRWYKWKAALQVVQALGRGVRHADDWCINYIVDGTWPQVAPYVPKWFQVDII